MTTSALAGSPRSSVAVPTTAVLIQRAWRAGVVVPAFNIPYLPMLEPTVRALRDTGTFGLIAVARLEWMKFGAQSLEAVAEEYRRHGDPRYTRLHLDHVPVIDEDQQAVDYADTIRRALAAGYDSVMVDGSRLSLAENIRCTREIVELAHAAGVPVEGELGAVMGHESGPTPPYDELFASGKGFTDADEAARFVAGTGVDWLSVAIGNIHGAIAQATKNQPKVAARLALDQLERIHAAAAVPLVLHGGSGIQREYLQRAFKLGIAKINVGTATRQPFERLVGQSLSQAQDAVYAAAVAVLREELGVTGTAAILGTI
jgi:fructose-bisphosphate aldolase class II